jgi:hypothetical protein
MKLLTTLLLAALGALAVYAARRRIIFALKTGAVLYIVLLFGRLGLSLFSVTDRIDEVIWPAVFVVLVWVLLWKVSTAYAERRDLQKKQARLRNASGAGRPGR